MKKLLNEIDELLAGLEDYIHGEDGNDITMIRGKIQKALQQPDVSSLYCSCETKGYGYTPPVCFKCKKEVELNK